MTSANDLKSLVPGLRVRWNDPDGGTCSVEGMITYCSAPDPDEWHSDAVIAIALSTADGPWESEVLLGELQMLSEPAVVRLFNEYGSTAGSNHADAIDEIMNGSMEELAMYLADNNVCPRDAMGYCVMIVTQHLSAYGLRRAMSMKRREREARTLSNKPKFENEHTSSSLKGAVHKTVQHPLP